MDWTQAVDIYCERTSATYWAEPANALSNVAFPLAALWAAVEARRRGIFTPIVWVLVIMAALIGVGSFLFHTHANRWSELADTLPIWSFVAVYVLASMHLVGGMAPARIARAAVIVAMIAGLTVWLLATGEGDNAGTRTSDPLNGFGQYAPALAALIVFSIVTARRHHRAAPWAIAATLVFLVSLIFRSVDMAVCPSLPLGTHFLWHLLNGLMVGLSLQLLIQNLPASRLRLNGSQT